MDAGRESGVVGEALQELDEVWPVGFVDTGEELCFLLVGGALGAGEKVVCGGGEVEGVRATIGRVAATLDEPPAFEVVDETDHHIAVDAHDVGELLLGLPLVPREMHEQPEMARPHAQRRQAVGELLRATGPQLRQQEAGTARERRFRRERSSIGHATMLAIVTVIDGDNHAEVGLG